MLPGKGRVEEQPLFNSRVNGELSHGDKHCTLVPGSGCYWQKAILKSQLQFLNVSILKSDTIVPVGLKILEDQL